MAVNIEIKARVRNFSELRRRAEKLSDTPVQVFNQEDTFFHISRGRLKLRFLRPDHGQLIYYERADAPGPKRSDYYIFETSDPERLKMVLMIALGVRGVIKKTRYYYSVDQTRIHLDEVEGLGIFVELEVVMRADQSMTEGQAIAEHLMKELGIEAVDLMDGAYMDLMEKASNLQT